MSIQDAINDVYGNDYKSTHKTMDNLYDDVNNGLINENGQVTLNEAYESLLIGSSVEDQEGPRTIEEAYIEMDKNQQQESIETPTSIYLP